MCWRKPRRWLDEDDRRPRLLLSARGAALTQVRARALASGDGVVLICGRFEGVDERIVAARNLEEISIGDYVLSGGEIAAMVVCDACVRLLPGVMGAEASSVEESFEGGFSNIRILRDPALGKASKSRSAADRRPRENQGLA